MPCILITFGRVADTPILEDGPEICDPEQPVECHGDTMTGVDTQGCESPKQALLTGRQEAKLKVPGRGVNRLLPAM
jgi:hypothetical protein